MEDQNGERESPKTAAQIDPRLCERRVYTLAETAVILRCSRKTVYRYASRGLVGIRIGGRYKFRSDEIERILLNGLPTLHPMSESNELNIRSIKPVKKERTRAWDR